MERILALAWISSSFELLIVLYLRMTIDTSIFNRMKLNRNRNITKKAYDCHSLFVVFLNVAYSVWFKPRKNSCTKDFHGFENFELIGPNRRDAVNIKPKRITSIDNMKFERS